MPMVIVTAQVQHPVKWEAGFRTHGDLFRKRFPPLTGPLHDHRKRSRDLHGAREREVV